MQEFAQKLALGTVQFGLNYGISNKAGKVPPKQVADILKTAAAAGVDTLDTAVAYGESETVLGEALTTTALPFQVISKLPNTVPVQAEQVFRESLSRLKLKKVYGFLVHDFSWFQTHLGIWDELNKLKDRQLVHKIGFSLYAPEQAHWLLENGYVPDLVQVPYNLFDQRFSSVIPVLKSKGVEVHLRSVFLQGLFFLNPEKLGPHFAPVKEKLAKAHALFSANQIPVEAGLLCFAWLCNGAGKLVIGVENAQQLQQNLEAEKYLAATREIYPELAHFSETNEAIILPTNWK